MKPGNWLKLAINLETLRLLLSRLSPHLYSVRPNVAFSGNIASLWSTNTYIQLGLAYSTEYGGSLKRTSVLLFIRGLSDSGSNFRRQPTGLGENARHLEWLLQGGASFLAACFLIKTLNLESGLSVVNVQPAADGTLVYSLQRIVSYRWIPMECSWNSGHVVQLYNQQQTIVSRLRFAEVIPVIANCCASINLLRLQWM